VSPDDAALVARARGGDVEAFAQFVRRHEARVRLVLARMLADDRDVEEATQDVFVQAWRHLGHYRGDAAVFTWLYRIAVNEALARLRRRQLQLTDIEDAGHQEALATAPEAGPEAQAQSMELREYLAEQLRLLPLEYRAPLVLRDVVGLSNNEVAEILELTVAATKSRVHRARMEIRDRLARWEAESEPASESP
jgi:RNA polymerase sigma-70 factor (ECF subfamily)